MANYYDYLGLIGYRIVKGEVLVKRKLLHLFSEMDYDITFEQWTVLNVLYDEPGLIQSQIANKTFKDKTNVTRILDVLSDKGYIVRKSHEKDRRSLRIYLTKEGLTMFDKLIPSIKLVDEKLRKDITDEEMRVFIKVIDKISDNAT